MTCCVIVAQGHAWPGFITHMGYDTAGARACLLATAEATMNVIRPRVSTAGRRQRQAVAPCPPDRQRGTSRREALHRRHRGSRHPGMTVPHDVRGLRLPCPLACPLTAVMLALLLPPPRNDSKQMPGNVTEYQMNSHYGSEGQLKPNLRTDTTRAKLWRGRAGSEKLSRAYHPDGGIYLQKAARESVRSQHWGRITVATVRFCRQHDGDIRAGGRCISNTIPSVCRAAGRTAMADLPGVSSPTLLSARGRTPPHVTLARRAQPVQTRPFGYRVQADGWGNGFGFGADGTGHCADRSHCDRLKRSSRTCSPIIERSVMPSVEAQAVAAVGHICRDMVIRCLT